MRTPFLNMYKVLLHFAGQNGFCIRSNHVFFVCGNDDNFYL